MNIVRKWNCRAWLEKASMTNGMTDRPASKNEPSQLLPVQDKDCAANWVCKIKVPLSQCAPGNSACAKSFFWTLNFAG